MLHKVQFKRPNLKEILKNGLCAVDMHSHSQYSDSISKVKWILKKAKRLGIGVAITDHNEIEGSLEALQQKTILVIPGIEVSSAEGIHLLIYFYDKEELVNFYVKHVHNFKTVNPQSKTKVKLLDLVNAAKNYRCITSLAHPFGFFWANVKGFTDVERKKIFKNLDAVEVLNGEFSRLRNLKAIELAIREDKCYTAGSDEHSLIELGSVLTLSEAHSVKGFLDSIMKKENLIVGTETNLLNMILSHGPGADTHFRHMPANLKLAYKHIYNKKIKGITQKTKETLITIKNNLK